jgi:hypothetical protein
LSPIKGIFVWTTVLKIDKFMKDINGRILHKYKFSITKAVLKKGRGILHEKRTKHAGSTLHQYHPHTGNGCCTGG